MKKMDFLFRGRQRLANCEKIPWLLVTYTNCCLVVVVIFGSEGNSASRCSSLFNLSFISIYENYDEKYVCPQYCHIVDRLPERKYSDLLFKYAFDSEMTDAELSP